jgi:hypothetical protein
MVICVLENRTCIFLRSRLDRCVFKIVETQVQNAEII